MYSNEAAVEQEERREPAVEPPYGIIWDGLMEGNVVPFLGAGASLVGRAPDSEWDYESSLFLPSGVELAHYLAKKAAFPASEPHERDDLAKVASYYEDSGGRPRLRSRLRKVLERHYEGGSVHKLLADVPAPLLIVVTNYDVLVEEAFRAKGKPYDLVIYPADQKEISDAVLWWPHGALEPKVETPNKLLIDLKKTTVIYKMHGTIMPEDEKWDNVVITEEDYVEFLFRMTTNTAIPSIFFEYFRCRSFLFLGYSLKDWNLRVVLKNLSNHFQKYLAATAHKECQSPYWAIQHNPSELEQKLWAKRGVDIYNVTIEDFAKELRKYTKG
jgi:hypothetical protein